MKGQDGHTYGARHIMEAFNSCGSIQDMIDNLEGFQELYNERKYYTNGRNNKIYMNLPIFKSKEKIMQEL